ncbi:tripartite tricarboxylate transporter substrate binding protein [Chelativorans sp. AA-79]|uniref:Bug family tripartite tricarboxylate transporter substrate binding protein n=1 Tax=Chelativorans sp. AA-79 TaxID=3028735 RepID=UPI0023FA02C1|nr:tripartite tricarboxylate transporter substrate binding protein [Chelativorans sp. AA-79]WEX10922.1 tripartite tricarboxylate transporter substrate binding protein [Chelativorans sp. AA-79]
MIASFSLALTGLGSSAIAQESDYPNDLVRVVVGSSPGGTADTVSRLIADALTEKFGQTFVVENLPGAGGALAAKTVKSAAPDGYTIQFIFSSFSILPSLNPEVGYDPVSDFEPIAMVSSAPNLLLVHPSFEVSTLAEWIEKVKESPGKFDYGSGGIGYSQHLSMEMLLQAMDGEAVHVPYTGSGNLLSALISGQVPFAFDTLTTAVPHIESGALIPLAITSAERSEILPDVPTVAEEIPGYELTAWNGFVAPAGTPREIIVRLNEAITEYLQTEKAKTFFAKLGTKIDASTPEEFKAIIVGDYEKFAEVIEHAGITAQ